MINANAQNPYDEVLYPHGAFEQTHPDRLATLATLFGMKPAPVERCRVLELGCATGGNILPMAAGLPEASFLGIDLSERQIEVGQSWIKRLGLSNIELKARNILELTRDIGIFDYIIAHGVYSWVPRTVQDKILALCRELLAPSGVAYISFNVLPGWAHRQMLREMMLYRARNTTDPRERAALGRELLRFLTTSAKDNAYKNLIQTELSRIERIGDSYFLHDDLSDANEALHFHTFAERAASHHLQYLGEAVFAHMQGHELPARAKEALRGLNDIVTYEQYIDILEGKAFRQTLLCHEEITLDRDLRPGHARRFLFTGKARPASQSPDLHSRKEESFETDAKGRIEVDAPIAKAALVHLAEIAPAAIGFEDLLAAARSRLGTITANPDYEAEILAATLMTAYSAALVELHIHAPEIEQTPGEYPTTSPLARLQATEGARVTTLWHQNWVVTDPVSARILPLLDGSRDRSALARALGITAKEPIERALESLAKNGMLARPPRAGPAITP